MKHYRPIDIARELNISTSALRHYESWGIIPPPERGANQYRLYTNEHLAYFRCLRAMIPGFGFPLTADVLRAVQDGDVDKAFWLVSGEQAQLYNEKTVAEQTLALLRNPDLSPIEGKKLKSHMTIGEAATLTEVPPSAIRHWEKEGLISPDRHPDNGYRLFTPMHIRQILLIRTMRRTVYFLENIKEVVHALEHHSMEEAQKMTEQALFTLHKRNRDQFWGIQKLMALCHEIGLIKEEWKNFYF